MKHLVVAIDGLAGSGKSTTSKALAERLGLKTLDTGASYRAITAAILNAGIDPSAVDAVAAFGLSVTLDLEEGAKVNGVDVTDQLRSEAVNQAVSAVAANAAIREILVGWQRQWVHNHGGGIVEGRDIGTVVFPDAALKLYLTADLAARGARRPEEGTQSVERRDQLDSSRHASPLRKADDALAIDTTSRSVEDIVEEALGALAKRLAQGRATVPGRGVHFHPDLSQSAFYRLCRGLVYGFMWLLFHPKVEGPGKVPPEGPAIISPVHRSAIDFGFSIFLTKRKVFFMTKDQLWKHKLLGKLLIVLGAFPVHRQSADRSALEHAESVLQAGGVLVMFPEGTRQSGHRVEHLMEGATFLAARTNAALIPVGIHGSELAWPKGQKLPRPHSVVLYAGNTLSVPERTAKGRVPRSALRAMTEQLRSSLENCLAAAASSARATKS